MGWIRFTAKHCHGDPAGWQANAHRAGATAARGWPLFIQTYDLRCAGTSVNAPRPAPKSGKGIKAVIAYARAQIGDPYRRNAAGPHAFDCSGLVVASYRRIGVHLPHYTGSLLGRGKRVSRANLRPGDLVFPSHHHVGIYIGGNRMIVAPHPGARVRIQRVYAFYAARRVL